MKNFRKVLALVLVVATLFSFTAMTSAAYEDADKISYDAAVDVLTAVGILNGYEVAEDEYEFKPTNTITREEMAKMIAVLANAGSDVSKLYASACTFADVPATKWSASYVAYCAKTGIVAGRSASTFDPAGKVTGLETAKMLLVVLGFDAETQGYVGADWKVNVLRDAKVMGLLNNFAADYDVDAAITREEAAQMMLNALEAPCVVGVLSNDKVTVTNALVFGDLSQFNLAELMQGKLGSLVDVIGYAKLQDAMKAGKWCLYGNVVISDDLLAEKLYGITVGVAGIDCFGRPATKWTLKGEVIATRNATPVWSSTAPTEKALKKAIADEEIDITTAKWYIDGVHSSYEAVYAALGRGVIAELYADGTVVVINTYLGKLGQVKTATGKFEVKNWTGTVIGELKNANYGFVHADEGCALLYWKCADGIHAVEETAPTTVTVDAIRGAAENFCDTAENVYYYAENMMDSYNFSVNEEVKVYTDKYGYVLYVGEVVDATYYAVLVRGSVLGSDKVQTSAGEKYTTWTGDFVQFSGDVVAATYEDDKATEAATLDKDHNDSYNWDSLVTYKIDSKGKYVEVTDAGDWMGATYTGYIAPNKASITGLNKYMTNSTKIILRVWDYNNGKYVYKFFDGMDEIDATYELDHVQYAVDATIETTLAYVYAEATAKKTANLAWIVSLKTDETWRGFLEEGKTTAQTYYLYNAYVGEEKAVIAYAKNDLTPATVYSASYELVAGVTHDGLPVYTVYAGKETAGAVDFMVVDGTLLYKVGSAVEGYAIDPAAEIYAMIWDISDEAYTVKAVSQADVVTYLSQHGWRQDGGYVAMNAAGDTVTGLYIEIAKP